MAEMNNAVTHPGHYTHGKIECIKYIMDKDLNFNLGNVVKYVTRAGRKGSDTRLQDLEKARQYLNFEIAEEKRKLKQGEEVMEALQLAFEEEAVTCK